jgi:hypothetical protein
MNDMNKYNQNEINKISLLTYNVYCGPPFLPTKNTGCLDKS